MTDSHDPFDHSSHESDHSGAEHEAKPPEPSHLDEHPTHFGGDPPEPPPHLGPERDSFGGERSAHTLLELAERHYGPDAHASAHPLTEIPGSGAFDGGRHVALGLEAIGDTRNSEGARDAGGSTGEDLAAAHGAPAAPHADVPGELTTVEFEPPRGEPLPPLEATLERTQLSDAAGPADAAQRVASTLWRAFGAGVPPSGAEGGIDPVASLERLAATVSDPFAHDVIRTAIEDLRAHP